MMYYNYHTFSPFLIIGPVISFLFWLLVIIVIIKLLKGHKRGEWTEMWGSRNAINILRERYARGEISKDEYEERRKVLEHK